MNKKQKMEKIIENEMTLYRSLGSQRNQIFKKYSLNMPQIEVLYHLFPSYTVTMQQVASHMNTTKGAATQIIQGLEREKYVERFKDNNDKRVVHVRLSKRGLNRFKKFRDSHIDLMSNVYDVLGQQELDYFIRIQRKLIGRIEVEG